MRQQLMTCAVLLAGFAATAQETPRSIANPPAQEITVIRNNAATPVKYQGITGTCWCFSTVSLIESQCLKNGAAGQPDLSEMFVVRNVYLMKARNYVKRQGAAQFGEGGLGHDVLIAAGRDGLMPESVYSGKLPGQEQFNHGKMADTLKKFLDTLLRRRPVDPKWEQGFAALMDQYMGAAPPAKFEYNGKTYTPQEYAKQVVKFDPADYVSLTSFTHHPFYSSFVLELPDNHANGSFYNISLNELIGATWNAVQKGYTVMWDADVSNRGFAHDGGYALSPKYDSLWNRQQPDPSAAEVNVTPEYRQELFEKLVTQDDHLMHITGIGKGKGDKRFFIVKNSWGVGSKFEGYLYVSEPYFAVNTINVVVPKAALDKELKKKLQLL
ncbi:C1 family peptidase [Chitinophaga sp.]|uniref:C1 family peptidase n=1 Tax=Chitinophaga sp. TaxID=1869181 RepID=UPI002601C74A|nr:C1 family peptidase [uncultured Chitinophaga sp.]